jgi:hypothetical protein
LGDNGFTDSYDDTDFTATLMCCACHGGEVVSAPCPDCGASVHSWGGDLFHPNTSASPNVLTDLRGMKGAVLAGVIGKFHTKCQVCGWDETQDGLVDMDPEQYGISVNVTFGPNTVNNTDIDESMLSGYAIFLVSTCEETLYEDTRLDKALAQVMKTNDEDPESADDCRCHGGSKYFVNVNFTLPEDGEEYRLMVVPVMDACQDTMSNAADQNGYTCDDYADKGWCTSTGGYGIHWNSESWGLFEDQSDDWQQLEFGRGIDSYFGSSAAICERHPHSDRCLL